MTEAPAPASTVFLALQRVSVWSLAAIALCFLGRGDCLHHTDTLVAKKVSGEEAEVTAS